MKVARGKKMWIRNFVSAIEKSTLASPKLEDAIAIKENHLPKRIYKYRCDSDKSRINLTNDTVWICSPQAYNDPYDCLFTVTEQDVVVAAKRSLIDDFVQTYKLDGIVSADAALLAKGSNDPFRELVKYIPPSHPFPRGANPQQMVDFLAAQLPKFIGDAIAFVHQIRDATKICSFSQRNDSIVMWGHYADKHRGFCIEYELESLPATHALRRNLYPVIYSSELYDLTHWASQLFDSPRAQFNPAAVLLALLRKYQDWRYEEEWRFILTEDHITPPRALSVPTPTRVFLGSKIEEPSKRELIELCRARGIEVRKMEMDPHGFKLKDSPIV
jgi:hypothetical protein